MHFISRPYASSITTQADKKGQVRLRGGLYVYPSPKKVKEFKLKIKTLISKNQNASVYKLIQLLNPIIRGWGNYFSVGTLRAFSRLDHFIFYRTYRFLCKKFKKVSKPILINRYYQGVESPSGRAWHFHGT